MVVRSKVGKGKWKGMRDVACGMRDVEDEKRQMGARMHWMDRRQRDAC